MVELFIISNPQKARTSEEELSLWEPYSPSQMTHVISSSIS